MKIYVIDKYNKLGKIINNLDYENIENKQNCKFKMNKSDYAILSENEELEGAEKLKNLIFIVQSIEYKKIWKLANDYKTIDIIDYNMTPEYIVDRINSKIKEKE